jgi:hypothetical protein
MAVRRGHERAPHGLATGGIGSTADVEVMAMANFLLTFHGEGGMPADADEAATIMAAWGAWFGRLGEAVVDPGNPTSHTKAISPDGSVMDATSAPTGYSIIRADSLDQAVELSKGCPVLAAGQVVLVSETFEAM